MTTIDRIAQVALDTARRHKGVARMSAGLADKLARRKTPGVTVHVDRDGWLHVDIAVVADNGSDLHTIGAEIQTAVIAAIRALYDQPLGCINVRVAGIDPLP